MNNHTLVIAAAGSGKTRKIVLDALKITDKNVLITTYTEANEAGIKQKIIKETGGYIPSNITVQTWFSFLLEHGVRPFQSIMHEDLWDKKISFYLTSGSSSIFRGRDGKVYSLSEEKQFFQYYFISSSNLMMHSDKVSEFAFKCDIKSKGDVIKRIASIFPYIFIDEVQDLAGYDLELLKLLFDSQSSILLVGDPRQGTYSTNNARKNNKFKKSQIINFFEDKKINQKVTKDDTSLIVNFRSNEPICNFSNKLFPRLNQTKSGQTVRTEHDGVFFIKQESVTEYLKRFPNCTQLRWDVRKSVNDNFPVMNFGDSKGLDFDRVLIYPTDPIKKWIQDNSFDLPPTSRCKFYVAITRARYSVGIVVNLDDQLNLDGVQKYEC